MEEMYHACMSCVNREVRIHTRNGECYEGVIVHVDSDNVYLRPLGGAWISANGKKTKKKTAKVSGWYGPGFGYGTGFGFDVVALSLFTLLAIALI